MAIKQNSQSIQEAILEHPRESFQERTSLAEKQRQQIVERFPREAWPDLPLKRYALGQEDSEEA